MIHPSTATLTLSGHPLGSSAPLAHEIMNLGDRELEDLIFSWQRVSDPTLRRIALELVRSMAS